jgi:Icc-related predicted phosphoesterase
MRLLALADIHGCIKHIPLLENTATNCDAIVVAGDITDFGGTDQARSVLSALNIFKKPVLGVSGNCDPPQVDDLLKQQGGGLVHSPVEMNGLVFMGFSYAATTEAVFLNEPVFQGSSKKPMVLVTHQPAWGTAVDLQASTRHKGSPLLRSYIEDHQPLLAVSGHIHEACGTDQIGSTLLVNPGPFRNGSYATIDINGDTAVAKLHWL